MKAFTKAKNLRKSGKGLAKSIKALKRERSRKIRRSSDIREVKRSGERDGI